ncbi:MAG: hypothetical protein J7494_01925 [Sphingobium sp.]|nr:hypothetical protein [Sphingobium sp.]
MSYLWQAFSSGSRQGGAVARPGGPCFLAGDRPDALADMARMWAGLRCESFALRHMITGPMDEAFAPTLVYGAGVDYADPRWPDLADLLEGEGLFEGCVQLMCERVTSDGSTMLVVLPAEDAPDGHYRQHIGHTRARTVMFNAIWRSAARFHATIQIFELTGFVRPEDAPDAGHFHAGFLQTLAGVVDGWLEGKGLPVARAA